MTVWVKGFLIRSLQEIEHVVVGSCQQEGLAVDVQQRTHVQVLYRTEHKHSAIAGVIGERPRSQGPWAAIQRRGSILARMVILAVYGADTIAIDLSLSTLISWFMKTIVGLLNNSNLHAIISTLLIIKLHWVKKNYLAALEEIYNNVGQQF